MKAWQYERQLTDNAIPVVLRDEEQTWEEILGESFREDERIKLLWGSNVPGSFAPERVIIGAIQSMDNMGYEVSVAEKLIEPGLKALKDNNMPDLNKITAMVFYELSKAAKIESHPFWKFKQYESFDEYAKNAKFDTYPKFDVNTTDFQERTYYGWLAQICGGGFGTALEGYTTDKLREAFGEIRGYVRKPNTYNDDITYELAFLKAFEENGFEVSSVDIAHEWVALVPGGWSAEDIALRNIRAGVYPPMSGYFNNPWREWIGAQMRGAICGMVAPGNPYEAARLAFIDGVISHHNNGVLGEIFNAVMVSLSYVETDVRVIIEKAMDAIPSDSEYYNIIKFAYDKCAQHGEWEKAWRECEEKFVEYNWIHAYPNAASEVISLWFGNGSFDETMYISAMTGQDVDCNAAQIATIIGIISMDTELTAKWTQPIGDDLITYVRGMKHMKITELGRWTTECVRKHIK
ncbi:MAG: ADP-ribosylglycohydrolase family protein [Clostridium sp.]